jgi:predicted transcriptional regulator
MKGPNALGRGHSMDLDRLKELGPLETRIMRALWERGNATVKELIAREGFRLAVTTVITTMDRLYRKGILERVAVSPGRTFRYSARFTQSELALKIATANIHKVLEMNPGPLPLSLLVEIIAERDERMLDELLRIVEAKRKNLRSPKS